MRSTFLAAHLFAATLLIGSLPAGAAVLINELEADQTGTDNAEFVELYNDDASPVALDGLVLVFFNGSTDTAYAAFDLDGFSIAAQGYFTVGASTVPGVDQTFSGATDQLQNGQDAVALYTGNASNFPNGTAATTANLLDALVYDTDDADDAGLLVLLNAGQAQINENGSGSAVTQSIQRQPNGAGGARNTSAYVTATPTPDANNGGSPPPAMVSRTFEIQGARHRSPMEGQSVTTRGIVTTIFPTTGSAKGFYIQDPDGDGNNTTSDGLFVFVGGAALPAIAPGSEVSVRGTVSEFRPGGASTQNLTSTQISGTSITVESTSVFINGSITPTILGAGGRTVPSDVIDDDTEGGDIEVAANTTFDPANDGVDFYESLEGMLVRVNEGLVTGPTNAFGEVFVVPDGGMGATGLNARGGITVNQTTGGEVDYNPERIQIDDDIFRAALGTMPAAKVGDTASTIDGIVTYNFGNFEVLPSLRPTFADGGLTRETAQVSTGADRLTIANFNVENLDINDNDICNGSALDNDVADGRFEAIAQQIVIHLGSPDIVALQEVQDDSGCTDDGTVVATQTLARVIDAIATAGGPTYSATEIAPVDNAEGGQPSGNIRVAYLHNASRVTLVPGTQGLGGSQAATAPVLDNGRLALTFSPGRIDPLNAAWGATRVSLAAVFEFNGQRVLAINNHWSSKGGSAPILGRVQPFTNGNENARDAQAGVVNTFVNAALAAQSNAKVAVLGDLNEFTFNAPLLTLTGADSGNGVLTDLADTLIADPAARYSYVFEGNAQALDHILVSDALLAPEVAVQFDAVHINSEFPDQLSDHDPDIASFRLPPVCGAGTVQFRRPSITVQEGIGTLQVQVTRTDGSCGSASASYAVTAGTANAGADFIASTGTLTWSDGEVADKFISVVVVDDTTNELRETVLLDLTGVGGATLGGNSGATLRINDNDPLSRLSLSPDQSLPEGTADAFIVFSLDRPSGRDVVVKLAVEGTATRNEDYRLNTGLNVRIPAGETSVTKVLHATQADLVSDLAAEPSETVGFVVTGLTGATL